MNDPWNPWDLTPTRMGVVIAVALLVAMIVAQWAKHQPLDDVELAPADTSAVGSATPAMPMDAAPVGSVRSVMPPATLMATCDRYVANRIGHPSKRALEDLDEMKKHDERYRRAYASCLRSHGYTG